MILQVALIVALFCVLVYAASQRRRAFVPSMSIALLSMLGIILVLSPDMANVIAQKVGVGRGADLVTYCFIVLTLVAIFNIHLRLRAENDKLTDLARAIALMGAQNPVQDR